MICPNCTHHGKTVELDEDLVCPHCGYDAVEEYEEAKRARIARDSEY